MFCFPETYKTRNAFSESRFLYLDERGEKTDLAISNNPNEENHEKIAEKKKHG